MSVTDDSPTSGANQGPASPQPVIFLPGIIMPAYLRYAALIESLGDAVNPVTKELEVYAGDTPPEDYSIEIEVEGVSRAADEAGFERFHLYGHSGGGASALAYAATHPERLLSLALDEPASDFSPEVKELTRLEMDRINRLPEGERMGGFVAFQLAPGVEPPPRPSGPAPEWMAKRPAGVQAIIGAMDRFNLPEDRLRTFSQPVYFSYGSLSNPLWEGMRRRLEGLFPNFTAERYDGLHHFNTSHAAEPQRVAEALKALWRRAASGAGTPT